MSSFTRLIGFLALFVVAPTPALAHMPVPGIEGFYLGLAHPFATPSHALLLLALGVLAGGFETERIQGFLGAFFLGMLTGLLEFGGKFVLHETMLATAVAASALAALAPAGFWMPAISATALGGFLLGVMTRDPGDIQDQLTVIAGTIVGANLGLLFFAAGLDWVREKAPWHWVMVAIRIAAAWISAISLLLFALFFAAMGAAS